MKNQNILIVGVGGQGVVLASSILAAAAMADGLDVKKTDTLGMAQRGGSVVSHLRYGDKVASPLIQAGSVDILLAFEKLEGLRLAHFLKCGGTAIGKDLAQPPLSVTLGQAGYPDDQRVAAVFGGITERYFPVPGSAKATELGNAKMVNTILLGFTAGFLTIDVGRLRRAISDSLPESLQEANMAAFEEGRRLALAPF